MRRRQKAPENATHPKTQEIDRLKICVFSLDCVRVLFGPCFPCWSFNWVSNSQNRTRTTSSTVLRTPPNRTRTKKFPLEELSGGCFLRWVLNWESTENWDLHRLERYPKPYSDTSWSVVFCDPSRHLQKSPARNRNRKKVSKGSFWGSAENCELAAKMAHKPWNREGPNPKRGSQRSKLYGGR